MGLVPINRNPGSSDEEKNIEGNAIYLIKNNMYTT